MRGNVLVLATCTQAQTIFVGGLPSSGTRVAAEALAHLGAKGWGDAAWDSGVGCCAAMGLIARRVKMTGALPTTRSFLSRAGSISLGAILRKQSHLYLHGRSHLRTADGTVLFVKEPELSLLLPWLPLSNASYVHVVRDGRDQALGDSSGWPLQLFGEALAPAGRPAHLRKLTCDSALSLICPRHRRDVTHGRFYAGSGPSGTRLPRRPSLILACRQSWCGSRTCAASGPRRPCAGWPPSCCRAQ